MNSTRVAEYFRHLESAVRTSQGVVYLPRKMLRGEKLKSIVDLEIPRKISSFSVMEFNTQGKSASAPLDPSLISRMFGKLFSRVEKNA